MNAKFLTHMAAAASLVLATTAVVAEPAAAQARRFSCGTSNGYPATVAHTRSGTAVPVIVWESSYFESSGYTPEVRCDLVSERFETYYQDGSLNQLRGGYMNNQPVVCTSNAAGGCDRLLFTLKPGTDPNQALLDLTNVRTRAASALYESVDGSSSYIDFNQLLLQLQDSEPADYAF
ncbi:COP23 domain-containing protein [Baaleninema sp.]|uniref:COP23 domain-containing protein n=1 Tax=Baaleninema sp. TaxID=3101197 RepID=UPI003CFFA9A0